ncbi:hypothetical protein L6452_02445 [Arctium lappa]|uniref:Uncharacterized protein n=1 Tax=Arctium lappa TaxID=4217 RepID=A0ACB9FJ36_ARCLA|nr:hypothetical protein L6452_02445 [Arctium lappa]
MAMGFRGVIMSRFADVYTSFMFYFSTDAKDICLIVARIKPLVTNQFPSCYSNQFRHAGDHHIPVTMIM